MTFVSLFAGIGGFDLGLDRWIFDPVGQVEIDPHAQDVLNRHFRDVPKHDDVTTLLHDTFEHPDLVTFGSPCQDLSVAGRRAGLSGERSGLFLEAVRYIREIQEATDGALPKLALWENVPGAFSSNDGHDFAAVLEALVGGEVRRPTDGWGQGGSYAGVAFGPLGSAEWRVLDSQHFGVPQRRKRVFLVYRPGSDSAGEVLLEPQGVQGDSAAGREAGEDVAGPLEARVDAGGFPGTDGAVSGHVIPDVAPSVLASWGHHGHSSPRGDGTDPIVPTSFNWQAAPAQGLMIDHDQAGPLDASQTKAVAFSGKDHGADAGPVAPTLRAMPHDASHTNGGGQVAVAFDTWNQTTGPTTQTLRDPNGTFGDALPAVAGSTAVRRLTPRECERLQGFPDDWTRYRPDGTEIADSHRYRMLGNAVTVNVIEWIARRLA